MDVIALKNLFLIILIIGAFATAIGTIGTVYFGNRADLVAPYIEPILISTADVRVVIRSDSDENITHATAGGYIVFVKGTSPLLTMFSSQCTSRQTGQGEVVYHAIFNMSTADSAIGKPVYFLKKETEYVQIEFIPMPAECEVRRGMATCTLNSKVRLEIDIPHQNITNKRIFVRSLDDVFVNFKNK